MIKIHVPSALLSVLGGGLAGSGYSKLMYGSPDMANIAVALIALGFLCFGAAVSITPKGPEDN